jgi:hypothetical protein
MVTGFPTPSVVDNFATPQSVVERVGAVEELFVDERRVSGVAVTRHPAFVEASILVGTVDVDEKLDG